MHNIRGENVNVCFQEALYLMKVSSIEMASRNGRVKMLPEPVCITYENPLRRVLFSPKRDCNPFFHLMEALWMLHGGRDVEFPARYAGNIRNYSDDGKTLHGAYGYRWIRHFGVNQLELITHELQRDADNRRCVLAMWDPRVDQDALSKGGKDLPCNTHAYFAVRPHGLDITVMNRSNDLVWGALGANAVHFAFLHEWMAWRINRPVGSYHQITNNLHIYEPHWWMLNDVDMLHIEPEYPADVTLLADEHVTHRQFDLELDRFMDRTEHSVLDNYAVPFIHDVARPMAIMWQQRKRGASYTEYLGLMPEHNDWRLAAAQWIGRRMEDAKAKA